MFLPSVCVHNNTRERKTSVFTFRLCSQFARAVFSENSLCTLEFSILVKMLHNIFGHNTDSVIFSGVLFCCMPSSNCFA